ncbi:hypothetical protein BDN71DRAFT_646209 [Pleurotus eryngii]|uniref:Uncharacterized protein n=1 Tax=Pleurotus eryngii TaxID=5323 RepID=A0A9P5ZZV0_PLEER|nr:hypothetical protein BDN71DRAFT_646209 [Pleurotus eryngii]
MKQSVDSEKENKKREIYKEGNGWWIGDGEGATTLATASRHGHVLVSPFPALLQVPATAPDTRPSTPSEPWIDCGASRSYRAGRHQGIGLVSMPRCCVDKSSILDCCFIKGLSSIFAVLALDSGSAVTYDLA